MSDENNKPLECRAAVKLDRIERNELVFLPAGLHEITPVSGGIGKPIKILIDAATAGVIETQRARIEARTDKRVYFDFNHEDGRASFWPTSFHWRESEGVIAKGEWSESGRRAVEGKDFRAFSPVFHVDDKRKEPARVICFESAAPNMGGLVNDPAFSDLPLWAKNAGDNAGAKQPNNNGEKDKMNEEELAKLRAKLAEQEKKVEQLTALVAKNAEDEPAKAQLTAAEAEVKAAALEIETAELKAKAAILNDTIQKRNKADADAAIKAAVLRGAIAPKDLVTQEKWRVQLTADPATFKPMLDAIVGSGKSLDKRMSYPHVGDVSISVEDPFNVYAKMARILKDSARATAHEDKIRLSEEFSAIYASSFKETEKNKELRSRLIGTRLQVADDAIKAADVTDTNLGTLAGTLVTQRTLELLKFIFPPLTRFTTDFSDQPATFNQTIMTRIITIPTVVSYSTATGWADSTAGTSDVPVVLNQHRGIQINFGENLLASTMRRLFDEFAEAQAYSLAKDLVDNPAGGLYSRFTDANYTNNTISASTAFNRAAVIDIGVALDLRGVPAGLGNNRTMLLWPAAFGNLEKDTSIIQFGTNVPAPSIITEGGQPIAFAINVEAFAIYKAANMPSNNANLVGFAGSKSALCMVTRTPNDYTTVLPGSSYGNVQMVTDPDIGITVMQVQFVDHVLGVARNRIALMYGTAAGQTNAGQLIKAAAGTGSAR